MTHWKFLGQGSYNSAYVSEDGLEVLKLQKRKHNLSDDYDTPERSVRLWNELNPHLSPPAYIVELDLNETTNGVTKQVRGKGWVCPYVAGEQAPDEDISDALIDIFNACGRIVVDAAAKRNFIKTSAGKVVCVDIGYALQMERRVEAHLSGGIIRRKSIISGRVWSWQMPYQLELLAKTSTRFPQTIAMVKALLFIKVNRPDIVEVSFLKRVPSLVTQLASAFFLSETPDAAVLAQLDRATSELRVESALPRRTADITLTVVDAKVDTPAQAALKIERPIHLDSIKENCVKVLNSYIISRGIINQQNIFEPSFFTRYCRNSALTTQKIMQVRQLIVKINSAESFNEIREAIENTRTLNRSSVGWVSDGLSLSLTTILPIVVTAHNEQMRCV